MLGPPSPLPSPTRSTAVSLFLHAFADVPGIVAGFSTRHGGASAPPYDTLNLGLSTGDDADDVRENRRRLFEPLGFDLADLAIAGQVHGARVKEVDAPGLFPGYDALVTRRPNTPLCITAADCAVVLLADIARGVVGACHAGWRGAVGGAVPATVEAMRRLGGEPGAFRAYVSPCISTAHFEVGPEVAARFDAAFVRHEPGWAKPHVDLKAALRHQLETAGIPGASIAVAPGCTVADNADFFSYRAETGTTGRMMGFIARSSRPARS